MKQVIVCCRVKRERAAENEELVRAVYAPKVETFKRFQENIADRCDEAPVVSSLSEIGSYRVFGD
jgi:hypothetical protein